MFSEHNLKKLDDLGKNYPESKPLVLPALWMAQEQFGWISPEVMRYVAGLLNLPVSHVYGVVTFYTMFNTKPVGKYHLQVCTNVSCMLRGGDRLLKHVCDRLQIRKGGTTSDNRITVSEVECLGSCGTAPAVQINDDYHENLSPERLDALLNGLS
ncbi:MAG TPA: NAD(P)H-dependent oxidoreductase subunit E [Bacteroidota bacterium]|nr:NAD(P)H-dependent oxidoreductase subunit E [Bacteroidota bacterium]